MRNILGAKAIGRFGSECLFLKDQNNTKQRRHERDDRDVFSNLFAKYSMFEGFRKFSEVWGRVRTCSDLFGCVRIRPDAFGSVRTRSEAFEKFCICFANLSKFFNARKCSYFRDVFRPVRACSDAFGRDRMHPEAFGRSRSCHIIPAKPLVPEISEIREMCALKASHN